MQIKNEKKALVVDDEKGVRDLFKILLEHEEYKVDTANDGLEGVEFVKKYPYDIIFLDVHMPRLTGPEALKEIMKIKPKSVVVIFSSSSDTELSFEKEAKSLGAFTCLYKPVNIDEIIGVIKEAVNNSKIRKN